MKRLLLLATLLTLGLSLAFVTGCDEDKGTNEEKAVGDTLDPVFGAIEEGFAGVDDMTPFMLSQSLEFAFFLLYDTSESVACKGSFDTKALRVASDSVFYTYHSSSQYWYFYGSHVDTSVSGDTVEDLTVEDSIQFLHGVNPVQWPDSNQLTGIKAGGSVSAYSAPADTLLFNQNFTIIGDIPGMGDVVINGNGQVTAAGDFDTDSLSSCHGSLTMTQTISNVELNLTTLEEDDCPTAGTVVNTGTVSIECTGDTTFSFSDSWTITQTFSGDIITIVFENSTTIWTVTYTCGGGTTAAPWNRFTGIVRNPY